jgi:hypothetical protein
VRMARIDLTAASISASLAVDLLLKPACTTAMGGVLASGVPKKADCVPRRPTGRNAMTSVFDVAPGPLELPAAILAIGLLPRRVLRGGREDSEGFG